MNYNEKTGDFEKTVSERIGYALGYMGWWGFTIVALSVFAVVIFKVGKLIWRWIGL